MNELEVRKQLLIMESNLNRSELLREMSEIKSGVRRRIRHNASKTEIAASAAALALALASTPRAQKAAASANHSRLQNALKSAALISNTLLVFLSQREK